MDFRLTDDQELIRETAREWADREVLPHVRDWDRAEQQMDRSITRKLGEVGFLGATVAEEYGGSPMDNISYCLMLEELGRRRGGCNRRRRNGPRRSDIGMERTLSGAG